MELIGNVANGHINSARPRKTDWWCALLILLSVFASQTMASATTYYIDSASGSDTNSGISKTAPWKLAPGMRGFTGTYTHSPGDIFVFKGGAIWRSSVLPMNIANNGADGKPDTYTTDHTWFSGESWSQPVFDGGGGGTQLITASDCAFITVDDFIFQNVGVSSHSDFFKALQFGDCHDLTLINNTLKPYSWIGLLIFGTNGTTQHNITIQNNDISNVVEGIIVATAGANTILNNVIVSGNQIHDFTSKIGAGFHGDGIHFWGQAGDASQYIQNGKIYGNRFYGSFIRSFGTSGAMTALIYLENIHSPYLIYNNVMSYSDTPGSGAFEALIDLRADSGNIAGAQIYNNSLLGTNPGMSAGIMLTNVPNVTIRNNILSGMKYCYYVDLGSIVGTTVDFNDVNCTDSWTPAGIWGATFYSLGPIFDGFPLWQELGNDTHRINSNPLWLSPPSDLHLQAASPAVGAGTNLSGVFNTDADGNPRPSTGAWTLGAYEGSVPPSTPPSDLIGN